MYFVDNRNATDPRLNLALEEYLLRQVLTDEPLLLFYVNEPAVIIGRHQNALEEIDPDYVAAQGIHVVRRLSGGGAVYHDLGNLNFSFVTPDRENLHNFAAFVNPVVDVLNRLGVPAALAGKSDIVVDGKKVSGNAQFSAGGRMFSHGTLLFDTNLAHMLAALNPRQTAIESRAVQSIRQFVTNIREWLPEEIDIGTLRQRLLEGLFGGAPREYVLSEADWAAVGRLRGERYAAWEWNIGRSPNYNVQKREQFPHGIVDVRLQVRKGVIEEAAIFGSFAAQRDLADLCSALQGVRHDAVALQEALAQLPVNAFIPGMDNAAFVALLF